MAEDIGSVSVGITGDLSDLQSKLEEATRLAEAAGTNIAEAMNSAFANGATTMQDALNQVLSSLQSAGSAGKDASSGIEQFGDEVKGAGDKAHEAASGTDKFTESAKHAGDAAHDAHGGAHELLETLLEFAGIELSIEALKELASEAVHASDSMTTATIALTTITGDASTAAEIIEGLEKVAMDDALSMPQLLTAATRLQNLLPEGTNVVDVLGKVADGAAVMGKDLETAAGKFATIVDGGNASARALNSLGLSTTDLQSAMESLGASADTAFKDLDKSDRVLVLETALDSLNGVAKDIADNTFGGQWQRLLNEMHQKMVDLGEAITPVATSALPALGAALQGVVTVGAIAAATIMQVVDAVVGIASVVATQVGGLVDTIKSLATGDFKGAAQIMTDTFNATKDSLSKTWQDMGQDAQKSADFINKIWGHDTKEALDKSGESAHEFSGKLKEVDTQMTTLRRSTKDFTDNFSTYLSEEATASLVTDAHQAKLSLLAQNASLAKQYLALVYGQYADGQKSLEDVAKATDAYESAQTKLNKALGEAPKFTGVVDKDTLTNLDAAKTSLDNIIGSVQAAPPFVSTLTSDMHDLGVKIDEATGDVVQKKFAAFTDLITNQEPSLEVVEASWGKISTAVNQLAKTDLPAAIELINTYITGLENAGAPIGEIYAAQQKELELEVQMAAQRGDQSTVWIGQLEQVRIKQGALYDSVNLYKSAFEGIRSAVDNAFGSLSKTVADAAVDSDNFWKAWHQALNNIEKQIMETIIGSVFSALKKSVMDGSSLMDNMAASFKGVIQGISSLFGGGGSIANLGTFGKDMGGLFGQLGESLTGFDQGLRTLAPGVSMTSDTLKGLGSNASDAASKTGSLGSAASSATSSLISTIGAIGSVVGAIGSIGSFIQGFSNSKDFGHIEENTRVTALEVQNMRADAWDQYGQTYDRLGEIWTAIQEGMNNIFTRLGEFQTAAIEGLKNIYDRIGESMGGMAADMASTAHNTATTATNTGTTATNTGTTATNTGSTATSSGQTATNTGTIATNTGQISTNTSGVNSTLGDIRTDAISHHAALVGILTNSDTTLGGIRTDAMSHHTQLVTAVNNLGTTISSHLTLLEAAAHNADTNNTAGHGNTSTRLDATNTALHDNQTATTNAGNTAAAGSIAAGSMVSTTIIQTSSVLNNTISNSGGGGGGTNNAQNQTDFEYLNRVLQEIGAMASGGGGGLGNTPPGGAGANPAADLYWMTSQFGGSAVQNRLNFSSLMQTALQAGNVNAFLQAAAGYMANNGGALPDWARNLDLSAISGNAANPGGIGIGNALNQLAGLNLPINTNSPLMTPFTTYTQTGYGLPPGPNVTSNTNPIPGSIPLPSTSGNSGGAFLPPGSVNSGFTAGIGSGVTGGMINMGVVGGAGDFTGRGIPTFDLGGFVPNDTLAMVHGGEYVIPADVLSRLRLPDVPNVNAPAGMPFSSGGASFNQPQVFTINVYGATNARQVAEQVVEMIKRSTPKVAAKSS